MQSSLHLDMLFEIHGTQKKCTGLTLPTKRDRNSPMTRSACSSCRQKQLGCLRIVGGVLVVPGERDRRVHLVGPGVDLSLNAQLMAFMVSP